MSNEKINNQSFDNERKLSDIQYLEYIDCVANFQSNNFFIF